MQTILYYGVDLMIISILCWLSIGLSIIFTGYIENIFLILATILIYTYLLENEKLQHMMEKLAKVLNPDKINQYVNQNMQGKNSIYASELPLNNTDDFVKMIYIRLYGQRKNMKYKIMAKEEVQCNGYRFRDFEIQRKD